MGVRHLRDIGYRETLDCLVVAFCRDYFSRKREVESGKCSLRTRMEYQYVNGRIADAAREIVGSDYEIYIKEIGEGIGYAYSDVECVSESSYKQLKKEVKINVARKLHLLD
jgi:hypothetical protein